MTLKILIFFFFYQINCINFDFKKLINKSKIFFKSEWSQSFSVILSYYFLYKIYKYSNKKEKIQEYKIEYSNFKEQLNLIENQEFFENNKKEFFQKFYNILLEAKNLIINKHQEDKFKINLNSFKDKIKEHSINFDLNVFEEKNDEKKLKNKLILDYDELEFLQQDGEYFQNQQPKEISIDYGNKNKEIKNIDKLNFIFDINFIDYDEFNFLDNYITYKPLDSDKYQCLKDYLDGLNKLNLFTRISVNTAIYGYLRNNKFFKAGKGKDSIDKVINISIKDNNFLNLIDGKNKLEKLFNYLKPFDKLLKDYHAILKEPNGKNLINEFIKNIKNYNLNESDYKKKNFVNVEFLNELKNSKISAISQKIENIENLILQFENMFILLKKIKIGILEKEKEINF